MIRLILTILIAMPLAAGTITTATCTTFSGSQTQTDQAYAQCSASDWPRQDIAAANGTVYTGLLSGLVSAWSFNDASATVSESFTESFAVTTRLQWDISVTLDGPWAYVALDLGPLTENYEEYTAQSSGEWDFAQTLLPGDYVFSASASVSDEGSAIFSADPPVPEPSTAMLILAGLVMIGMVIMARKAKGVD